MVLCCFYSHNFTIYNIHAYRTYSH